MHTAVKTTILLSGVMSLMMAMSAAQAQDITTWLGQDLNEDSNYTYLGGVKALNNDLEQSGYLVRGSAGFGNYDYSNGLSSIDGDSYALDLSLGYQHFFSADTRLTGYLGVAYQEHDLSPKDASI